MKIHENSRNFKKNNENSRNNYTKSPKFTKKSKNLSKFRKIQENSRKFIKIHESSRKFTLVLCRFDTRGSGWGVTSYRRTTGARCVFLCWLCVYNPHQWIINPLPPTPITQSCTNNPPRGIASAKPISLLNPDSLVILVLNRVSGSNWNCSGSSGIGFVLVLRFWASAIWLSGGNWVSVLTHIVSHLRRWKYFGANSYRFSFAPVKVFWC